MTSEETVKLALLLVIELNPREELSDGEEAILIGVSRPTLRAIREQKQYLHVVNH